MHLSALVRVLHLASPALPVGAFSYSQGLESAAERGWVTDAESAGVWLEDLLEHVVGRLEAPLWLRLHRAWSAGDEGAATRWNELYLASREAAELRLETVQLGYSLRRLLGSLEDGRLAPLPTWEEPSFPALFALAAVRWGVPAAEGLTAYLWGWLEGQVTAAVKVIPLGQTEGQRLLWRLGERLPEIAGRAVEVEDEEMAGGAPAFGVASALHETQHTRLFRS